MTYDCIIVGAGPGGVQAAIYLGRFNRKVLILDRPGGRTRHAPHIENYLGIPHANGANIIQTGIEQALSFNAELLKAKVTSVEKEADGGDFIVLAGEDSWRARFVIASTGVRENLPPIGNAGRFFGESFYTCVACDGYRTIGRKLLVMGNSEESIRLAIGMKEMYTKDMTLLLVDYEPPPGYPELLADEGVGLVLGKPAKLIGTERLEGVLLEDGKEIQCEAVMSHFGIILNDEYLKGIAPKRDSNGHKIIVDMDFQSSVDGLYVVGPLNTGNSQIVIAAGEGAAAALDINSRLLSL